MPPENNNKSVKLKTKRRAHLPKLPFNNIALSLSGGGFRATCNHLGVLSYLRSVTLGGVSLLERTRILSTVSGGTFVGVKYVATLKRGGDFYECYKSLVDFMTTKDLVEDALQYLAEDSNWHDGRQRSLINAFASMYYEYLEKGHFGLLWDETRPIHLKEISFNATEFHFALPFHFLKTEFPLTREHGHKEHVGNRKIAVPVEMAKEIRLADIIAASSCVPFGFEPINFPDDFVHPDSQKLKDKSLLPKTVYDGDRIDFPIGLMDGGVDDNQGVDAVLSAEERLRNYPDELSHLRSKDRKAVDLYIISDGTNPNMVRYTRSFRDKIPYVGNLSFKILQYFGISSSVVGLVALTAAFFANYKLLVMGLSVLGTVGILTALVLLIFSKGFTGLTRKLGVPAFFETRMRHVDRLKFATLNNLIVNRRNSAAKMITKVFIKQMRWFGFERVYGDPSWKPRVVLSAVFELTKEEVRKRKKKYPYFSTELTEPGDRIIEVSTKALRMGTTLWFTKEEIKRNMPDTILACGQFSMCFNLLEYFEKFLLNPKYSRDYEKYSPEVKHDLQQLHEQLLRDWRKFKEDPYWMVKEINLKIGRQSSQ